MANREEGKKKKTRPEPGTFGKRFSKAASAAQEERARNLAMKFFAGNDAGKERRGRGQE